MGIFGNTKIDIIKRVNNPINLEDENNIINLKKNIAKYIESLSLQEKYYLNSYICRTKVLGRNYTKRKI